MIGFDVLLLPPSAALLALAAFFAIEIFGAFLTTRKGAQNELPGRIAVIIPAHNEDGVIGSLLEELNPTLRADDILIVVADNCDDETAQVARRGGAIVLERNEPKLRGKGYALQYGLEYLKDCPPDIVFFVDADCRLGPDAIFTACARAMASDRPVQALYLMQPRAGAAPSRRISAFAWVLMNRVRMSGLFRLFDVTRLTGAGIALPWRIARELNIASGEIVEDLALTAMLVQNGSYPELCLDAHVESHFPENEIGEMSQRARWEIGSLRFALGTAPSLVLEGVRSKNWRQVAIGLDVAVPPMTVMVLLTVVLVLLSLALGAQLSLYSNLISLMLTLVATFAAWMRFGRKILPLSALAGAPRFFFAKARIHGTEGRSSARTWTRTNRDSGVPQ